MPSCRDAGVLGSGYLSLVLLLQLHWVVTRAQKMPLVSSLLHQFCMGIISATAHTNWDRIFGHTKSSKSCGSWSQLCLVLIDGSQQVGDESVWAVKASLLLNCCYKSAVSSPATDQLITWSEWGSLLHGTNNPWMFSALLQFSLVCACSGSWVRGCWCLSAATDCRVQIKPCRAVMARGLICNTHFRSSVWCRTGHW